MEDEIVLVVTKSHPLASRATIHAADLEGETIFLHASQNNRSTVVDEFLRPAGVVPASLQYVQLTEGIVEMVPKSIEAAQVGGF